ncbi:MAG: 50S ribosomal protein L30 [Spirochaetia bacterium]|nr:50S ribosomal protein L30 [Spirochaetia bacterium]
MAEQFVKVKLVKSPIGRFPIHRRTLRALGLRRVGHERIHKVTPVIQGMIDQVAYMLTVEATTEKRA